MTRSLLDLARARVPFAAALAILGATFILRADDSAVSIGAGGVQLSKEARISMQTEHLEITIEKVVVEFGFLNETSKPIITEVGFPIPPYKWGDWEPGLRRDFSDFHVWVDGEQVNYQTDVRGKLNGTDYTDTLQAFRLPIDFAPANKDDGDAYDDAPIRKLPAADREKLLSLGLLKRSDKGEYYREWSDYKFYHWSQAFPPGRLVHIRHEYTPAEGYEPIELDELSSRLASACIGNPTLEKLRARIQRRPKEAGAYIYSSWVDYILTSANTWKTPIKSFELVVERPEPDRNLGPYDVSFCWGGKVDHPDANHFVARAENFIPKGELRIAFIPVDNP